MKAIVPALALLAASVPPALAQQFVQQVGLLPGPVQWTEAVWPLDCDADGRMDVLLVRANGWQVPGDLSAPNSSPLRPTLLRNTGIVAGNPTFADETTLWLPAGLLMHGKSVVTADLDDDGDDDLVFAAAFGAQPRLLLKQSLTGPWTDATANLPTMSLNSFSVAAADLDADGDLDLVFNDAGPNSFSGTGGKARLLINDGTAHFVEQSTWLNAVNKIGSQNVRVVDIDNDFDLDLTVDGKSAQTQLYKNDGTAHFTLDLTTVPAGNGGLLTGCYETDYADLDNDSDIDILLMSFPGNSSLSDAVARNNLIQSGTLSFTASTSLLAGANGHDDNEFAFVDSDNDGDLDVIDATLGNIEEKLYINNQPGTPSWSFQFTSNTGFSFIKDGTLDIALADFDQDGDFDAVTGQGESGSFQHRYYRNQGPADTRAPTIGRIQSTPATIPLATFTAGTLRRRAFIQDAMVDDGTNNVHATFEYTVANGVSVTPYSVKARHAGGELFQAALSAPAAADQVGATVSWSVRAVDHNGNVATSSAQAFKLCGTESYGPATGVNSLTLSALGSPTLGQSFGVAIGGGAASAPGVLVVSAARVNVPAFGGALLVDLSGAVPTVVLPTTFDALGQFAAQTVLGSDPGLVGASIYLQAIGLDAGQPFGIALSPGLAVCFCGN